MRLVQEAEDISERSNAASLRTNISGREVMWLLLKTEDISGGINMAGQEVRRHQCGH